MHGNPGNLSPQKEKLPVKNWQYPTMPGLQRVARKRPPAKKNPDYPEYDHDPDSQFNYGEDAYRVPAVAVGIILVNFALWALFMLLYWLSTAPLLQAIGAFFALVLAMGLYLAIQYIVWRFFWWFLALSTCVSTLALLYLILALFTGTNTILTGFNLR